MEDGKNASVLNSKCKVDWANPMLKENSEVFLNLVFLLVIIRKQNVPHSVCR